MKQNNVHQVKTEHRYDQLMGLGWKTEHIWVTSHN
jgi:hypothetical protein